MFPNVYEMVFASVSSVYDQLTSSVSLIVSPSMTTTAVVP